MAKAITEELKSSAGECSPVAFVATNAPSELVCLYAIWLSGNVAVPVGKGHEFEDALRDAGCRLIIVTDSESASKAGYLQGGAVLEEKCLYWVLWVLWVVWGLGPRLPRQTKKFSRNSGLGLSSL